jgi:hypothetical protein
VKTFQGEKGSILCGARPWQSPLPGYLFQPALRLIVFGETPLIGPERCSVIVTTPIDHSRGMLYVKHFVVEDELHEPLRNLG